VLNGAEFSPRELHLSLKYCVLHQLQGQDSPELLAGGDVAAKMHTADQAMLGIFRRPREDGLGFFGPVR
jgi:hypothetical protein